MFVFDLPAVWKFCWAVLRFKLLKWWAQSFLPGVPRVVAGFRDHDGAVVSVETFHISKISHLIKVQCDEWLGKPILTISAHKSNLPPVNLRSHDSFKNIFCLLYSSWTGWIQLLETNSLYELLLWFLVFCETCSYWGQSWVSCNDTHNVINLIHLK